MAKEMNLDWLVPVGVLALGGYLVVKLLPTVEAALMGGLGGGGLGGGGSASPLVDPTMGKPAVNTGVYQALAAITTMIKSPGEPESLSGGGSWTRYALPATPALTALVAGWTPPGQAALVALQSGREQPIAGQVAVYNPATGNAWGGEIPTMEYLYTAGAGAVCSLEAMNACPTAQCTNDLTAACWRARYG